MTVYLSTPLDASRKEIRLLHLHPASDINDEISGALTTAALEDATTKFEALSYTWGGSTENRTIQLNNGKGRQAVIVTDNLYYALRRLRNRRTERIVWIDAICINQKDLDEKSYQVAMMGDIYSRADRVRIWIGESEKAERAEPGIQGSVKVKYWKLYRQPNAVMFTRHVHHFIEAIRKTVPHWWERAWILKDKKTRRDKYEKKHLGSKDWYKCELGKKKEKDHSLDYLAHGLILWEETADFPPTFPSGYDNSFGLTLGKYDWYGHLESYGKVTAGKAEILITKMGLVGVAPAGIREGDAVVVLDGARLPIVLSTREDRADGEFVFRGYAYVHGCMERGYQNWHLRELHEKERKKRRQKFVIC